MAVNFSKESIQDAAKQSGMSINEYLDALPSSYYLDAAKQSGMSTDEYLSELKNVWGESTTIAEPVKKKEQPIPSKALPGLGSPMEEGDTESISPNFSSAFTKPSSPQLAAGQSAAIQQPTEVPIAESAVSPTITQPAKRTEFVTKATPEEGYKAPAVQSFAKQMKQEGVLQEKPIDDFFNDSIQFVNKDLIGKSADEVANSLQYHFGDYGFDFYSTGESGQVVAKSKDGKEIKIPADALFDFQNQDMADKMKDFLRQNRTESERLKTIESGAIQKEKKIINQDEVKQRVKSIDDETQSFNQDIKLYLQAKALYDDQKNKYLNVTPEQLSADPQLKADYDQFIANRKRLSEIGSNIAQQEKDLKDRSIALQSAVGKYTASKASTGTWGGALWNTMVDEVGNIIGGGIGILKDIYATNKPLDRESQEYKDNFIKAAKQKGIEVPEGQDFNTFYKNNFKNIVDIESQMRDNMKKEAKYGAEGKIGNVEEIKNTLKDYLSAEGTTPEYINKLEQTTLGKGVLGVARVAPAMVAAAYSGNAGFLTAALSAHENIMQQMNTPAFKDVSEDDKNKFAAPYAIVNGLLMSGGFAKAAAQEGFVNGLVARALSKLTKGSGAKTFSDFVARDIENFAAKRILTVAGGFTSGFETGVELAAFNMAMKDVYNDFKGKEMFNTPKDWEEYAKVLGESGLVMGIGGGILSIPKAMNVYHLSPIQEEFKGPLLDNGTFEIFEQTAKDPEYQNMIKVDYQNKINQGLITFEQAKKEFDNYIQLKGLLQTVDPALTTEQRKEALAILQERQQLEKDIAGKDPNLGTIKAKQDRIAKLNIMLSNIATPSYTIEGKSLDKQEFVDRINSMGKEELSKLNANVSNDTEVQKLLENKLQENAIQKPSTETGVLRTEQPEVGLQKVGEGDTEIQTVAEEGGQVPAPKEGEVTAEVKPEVTPTEVTPEVKIEPVKTEPAKTETAKTNPEQQKTIFRILEKAFYEGNDKRFDEISDEVLKNLPPDVRKYLLDLYEALKPYNSTFKRLGKITNLETNKEIKTDDEKIKYVTSSYFSGFGRESSELGSSLNPIHKDLILPLPSEKVLSDINKLFDAKITDKELKILSEAKPAETPAAKEGEVAEPLKDIESTTKALEGKSENIITPLTEKQFNKKYVAQHKDLRGKTEGVWESNKKQILEKGFEEGANINALPIYIGVETNVIEKRFGNKKGDIVYILPKEGVIEDRNGYKTKQGYKPNLDQIVVIEYDKQPTYEAYKNQLKNPSFIAEAYHKAKADGSNPELVKAVEDVVGKPAEAPAPKEGEVTAEARGVGLGEDVKVKVYHGGGVKSEKDMWEGKPLFVSKDKSQAHEYTKGNNGKVVEFLLDNKKIATEDDARKIISELGLQSKEKGWDTNELNLFELIDPTFDTAFSDKDIKKLFKELEKKGYEGIEFTDTNLKTLKQDIQSIVVFNPQKTFKTVEDVVGKPAEAIKEEPKIEEEAKSEEPKVEEPSKMESAKSMIAEGLDELAKALGISKGIEGEKAPSVVDALTKIAKGLIEAGEATSENILTKLKEYVRTKLGKNLDEQIDANNEQIVRFVRKEEGLKEKAAPSVGKILGTLKDVTKVTMTEKTALKKQIKDLARGAREAKQAWSKVNIELAKELNELAKGNKLSVKQVKSITNKLGKLNVFNEEAVARFVGYMDKVFQDAEYSDKLSTANGLRKTIKKISKNKDKDVNLTKLGKDFSAIDPSLVDDIDAYNAMGEKIKESIKGSTLKPRGVKLADMVNVEDAMLYVNEAMNKQREELAKIKAEEIKNILNIDVSEEPITKDNEKIIRDTIKKYFDEYSDIAEKMIVSGEDVFTGEEVEFTSKQKELIKKFMDMDLNQLSPKDALGAVDALNNFTQNHSTAKMASTVAKYTGAKNAKDLANRNIKATPLTTYMRKDLGRTFGEQLTTLPVLIETMFAGYNKGALVRKEMGLTELVNKKAQAEYKANKIIEDYVGKFYDRKANGEIFNSEDNMTERGIIAFTTRNVIGTPDEMQNEFNRRKGLIEQSIDVLRDGSESEQKKAELYQKAYDKLLSKSNNANEVREKADANNVEAVDWWVEKWADEYDDLSDISQSIYNKILDKDSGYTTDRYTKLEGVEKEKEELTNEQSAFYRNNNATYKKSSGVLMEATKPEMLPKNKSGEPLMYVDLSFDNINSNALYDALMDMNTAAPIRQVEAFYESKDFKKIIPSLEDREMLKNRIKSYIRDSRDKNIVETNELNNILRKLNKITTIGVGQALGGIGQSVKQVVPVATNTFINAGKLNISNLYNKDVMSFIDNSGRSIANRGSLSQVQIETLNRLVDKVDKSKGEQLVDAVENLQKWWLKTFLVRPDVFIARASWLTYYEKYLKDHDLYKTTETIYTDSGQLTIEKEGIDYSKHKLNEDAADYAQDMVDRQQNISDHDLAGQFLTTKDPFKGVARQVGMPFASFRMNQIMRIHSDWSILKNPTATSEDKKIAARSLGGAAGEMLMFKVIQLGLGIGITSLMLSLMGEDEKEADFKKRLSNSFKGQMTGAVTDVLSPLPLTDRPIQFVFNSAIDKAQEAAGVSEKDRINIFDGSQSDVFQTLGTFGITGKRAYDIYNIGNLAATGKFKDDYGNERFITKDQQDKLKAITGISIIGNSGVLPNEVNSAINGYVKFIKKNAKTKKQLEKEALMQGYESIKEMKSTEEGRQIYEETFGKGSDYYEKKQEEKERKAELSLEEPTPKSKKAEKSTFGSRKFGE